MAFGIIPKFKRDLNLEDITAEQFLVIAVESVKNIGWSVGQITENGFIAYSKISLSSWGEEIRITINSNIAVLESVSTGGQLTDWGKNKTNIKLFVDTFNELKSGFSPDELLEHYGKLKTVFVSAEDSELNKSPLSARNKISGFYAIFKPVEGYFITPLLVDLNIVVFILMVISGVNILLPDSESLMLWGANLRPYTLQGDWWRLITCCFLHIGIFHLLMNMYALLYIGLILEPYLGKARFITAYLLTGVASSVCSMWWHELTISAGASGAIFGMYGVFLAMLTTNLIEKTTRKALLVSIGVFVAYNLVNGLKDGIDNAAHMGGLICGLFVGYGFYPSLKSSMYEFEGYSAKKISLVIVPAVVSFACYLVYIHVPVTTNKVVLTQNVTENLDIDNYRAKMKEFESTESMALEVLKMSNETPKEQLLSEIKNRGIYYWNESIQILNEADSLDLPPDLHQRNRLLLDYCELRIKSYELLYTKVEEGTDLLQPQQEEYDKQIKEIIDQLK